MDHLWEQKVKFCFFIQVRLQGCFPYSSLFTYTVAWCGSQSVLFYSKKRLKSCIYRVTLMVLVVVIVQWLSHVWLLVTPWAAPCQAFLPFTISRSLLRIMPIESMMPSNHLILCRPLLPLPSISPSIRVFSNEPTLRIMWPKYCSFSFSISPSSEYSRLMVLPPTSVFLPGKSYGQRSLEGYSPKSWTPLSNFAFHFEDTNTGRTEENTLKQWPWSPLRERILPCAFPCSPQQPS